MHSSLFKIGLLSMCCAIFTSCMSTSTWLSGDSPSQKDFLHPPSTFAPIKIGISTKEEVEANLGNPTRQDIRTLDDFTSESVSYSSAETTMNPFQYFPFLGALALRNPVGSHIPSAAISFSSDNRVSGLTISSVNAYGDIRSSGAPIRNSLNPFYGMRNPDVSQTFVDSIP